MQNILLFLVQNPKIHFFTINQLFHHSWIFNCFHKCCFIIIVLAINQSWILCFQENRAGMQNIVFYCMMKSIHSFVVCFHITWNRFIFATIKKISNYFNDIYNTYQCTNISVVNFWSQYLNENISIISKLCPWIKLQNTDTSYPFYSITTLEQRMYTPFWNVSLSILRSQMNLSTMEMILGSHKIDNIHSSEIRSLCLVKWLSETLQNLPYFIHTKTQSCFFSFSFCAALFFSPNNALVYVNTDQDIH